MQPPTGNGIPDTPPTGAPPTGAPRREGLAGRVPEILAGAAGVYGILAVLIVSVGFRLGYPYELEWMEGGMLCHIERVARGAPIYIAPSVEHTALLYPPLYYYAALGVTSVLGMNFFGLRLASLVCTLLTAGLLALLVHRRTGDRLPAFLAAALYLSSYVIVGAWYDLVRVDAPFLLLLILGCGLYVWREDAAGAALSALVLALAFQTKQSAVFVIAALCLHALIYRRGAPRAVFVAACAVLLAVPVAVLHVQSDGWFRYFVFEMPANHPIRPRMVLQGFWFEDLFLNYLFLLPVIAPWAVSRARRLIRSDGMLDGLVLVSLVGTAWSSRIHTGGAENVLMPAVAAMSLAAGWGLAALRAWSGPRRALYRVGLAAVTVQLVTLTLGVWDLRPHPSAAAEGDRLIARVAAVDGEVFFPAHPWYLAMAGKPIHAHHAAFWDVRRSAGSEAAWEPFRNELHQRLSNRQYAAIILDGGSEMLDHVDVLLQGYALVEENLTDPIFATLTGARKWPQQLFLRREPENLSPTPEEETAAALPVVTVEP